VFSLGFFDRFFFALAFFALYFLLLLFNCQVSISLLPNFGELVYYITSLFACQEVFEIFSKFFDQAFEVNLLPLFTAALLFYHFAFYLSRVF